MRSALEGPEFRVYTCCWGPRGDWLATGGGDYKVSHLTCHACLIWIGYCIGTERGHGANVSETTVCRATA